MISVFSCASSRLKYAYALTPQVTAVHIASDPSRTAKVLKHWAEQRIEIPLEIVESPYRAIVHDLLYYIGSNIYPIE